MKHIIWTVVAITAAITPAHADGWRLGPQISYYSGVGDISDLYEANFDNTNVLAKAADTDFRTPIGLAFQGTYNWDSGMRLDLGAGPFYYMTGVSENYDETYEVDYHHFEFPLTATFGFTFLTGSDTSPYVRAGVSYHYASGTYVEGSTPGWLAAAGLEFNRSGRVVYSFEAAVDQAEVEIERFQASPLRRDTVELNTYDVIVSFIVRF